MARAPLTDDQLWNLITVDDGVSDDVLAHAFGEDLHRPRNALVCRTPGLDMFGQLRHMFRVWRSLHQAGVPRWTSVVSSGVPTRASQADERRLRCPSVGGDASGRAQAEAGANAPVHRSPHQRVSHGVEANALRDD